MYSAWRRPDHDGTRTVQAEGYGHDALWWKTFFATLAEGDYHGLLSIEIEDPLMPNNLVAIQKSAVISE